MAEHSIYYVPAKPLTPGPALDEMGRRLWQLGMPFIKRTDYGDLPDDPYDIELQYADMGIVHSELGDPVPNSIDELSCPHCQSDLMQSAYDIWNDEDNPTPTQERIILCPDCQTPLTGDQLVSGQPFTFATSYLYVSDFDADYWPDKVKTDIEGIIGPCVEYRAWET